MHCVPIESERGPVSGGVISINSSDSKVSLPALGTGCAVALQDLYSQGFRRQDVLADDFVWVLVREFHD